MRDFVARGQPEGRNGWDELVAVLASREVDGEDAPPDYDEEPGAVAAERRYEAELEALAADDAYFDALRAALAAPRIVRPFDFDGPLTQEWMPWLAQSRQAARALRRRAVAAAKRGDWGAFRTEVDMMNDLGHAIGRQQGPLPSSVGIAIEMHAIDTVIAALSVHALSAADAESLVDRRSSRLDYGAESAIEFARLHVRRALAAAYGSRGYALPVDGPGEQERSVARAVRARFSVATWEESVALIDRFFDELQEQRADPTRPSSGLEVAEALSSPRYALVDSFVWYGLVDVSIVNRIRTHRAALRTIVAIERYEAEYGAPPATLDALVPTFIDAVPMDHMRGEPLRYRLDDDGAWLLYSVGRNGVDDAGANRGRDAWRADYDADDFGRWPETADDIAWNRVDAERDFE